MAFLVQRKACRSKLAPQTACQHTAPWRALPPLQLPPLTQKATIESYTLIREVVKFMWWKGVNQY